MRGRTGCNHASSRTTRLLQPQAKANSKSRPSTASDLSSSVSLLARAAGLVRLTGSLPSYHLHLIRLILLAAGPGRSSRFLSQENSSFLTLGDLRQGSLCVDLYSEFVSLSLSLCLVGFCVLVVRAAWGRGNSIYIPNQPARSLASAVHSHHDRLTQVDGASFATAL